MTASRAQLEWARRVQAEYRSAATTARVLHLSIAAGLPRPLLDTARRIVGDELDHAELSHAVLVDLGGADVPVGVELAELVPAPPADAPVAELLATVLHSFCFGETLAVPLFRAMRAHASRPSALAALDRILRDEAVHRAFGWQALDALLALDAAGVRDFVGQRLHPTARSFARAYAELPESPPLTSEEQAAGLLHTTAYKRIFIDTLTGDISGRLTARGLGALHWPLPEAPARSAPEMR